MLRESMDLFGKKRAADDQEKAHNKEKAKLASNWIEAEGRFLEGLRREIANLIVAIDPDLMTRCYDKAWDFEREMSANVNRAEAEEVALFVKFPHFSDFDLRHLSYTPTYNHLRISASDDELVDRYLDISRMLVFLRRRDTIKSTIPVHTEKEYKLLCSGMQTLKNVRLYKMIDETMNKYHWYCDGLEKNDPSISGNRIGFENDEIKIVYLPESWSGKWGIVFKKTGEFGVCKFSVSGDGEASGLYKTSFSYYRSDALFENHELVGFA